MTDGTSSPVSAAPAEPQFRYVEEFVRHQLSTSLGDLTIALDAAAAPLAVNNFVFLARYHYYEGVIFHRRLYPCLGAALGVALVLAVVRLAQRQSLKFVAQAILPIVIAAVIASRTGRAQDIFLPGILINGVLALVSGLTIAIRWPLVGFVIGAALGDPTGWAKDRGLVRMTSKLTAVLAVPYVLRFALQLPLFLTGQVGWLGVTHVVLGWPLLIAALFVIGLMLSKGRTPMADSGLADSTTG